MTALLALARPGLVVWAVLAAAAVAWVVLSAWCPRLPGPVAVARWVVASWLGRILALAGWAAAGWHLFCQRP